MSGLGFLRERRALKEFEALDPSFRELVFYSEGSGDWPHIGPVVEALLRDHDRSRHVPELGSGRPGLALDHPRLRSFLIGSGTVRTILFARIDCAHFVMTLPDLDQLWLKRSPHPVHYVYLFHSMNSTHAAYRKGAFDAYDTVLCVGPHHVDEIRKTEERYGLRPKELVEHGSVKLDTVLARGGRPRGRDRAGRSTPGARRSVVGRLLAHRAPGRHRARRRAARRRVPDRPPPASDDGPAASEARRDLRRRFAAQPGFRPRGGHERGRLVAALGRDGQRLVGRGPRVRVRPRRPVVYVDTPQKTVNDDWQEIESVPFEDAMRDELGLVVPEARGRGAAGGDRGGLADTAALVRAALRVRERSVFNVGSSAEVAAGYLASLRGDGREGGGAR